MIVTSNFKPAWWLYSAHAQTIYPTLTRRPGIGPVSRRERIELPDGDFIDISWADNDLLPDRPLVILLHGLGGNMQSSYVSGLLTAFNQQGWRAMLMHFRGASDESNRLARAYHSGDTADFNFLLNLLAEREPDTQKAAVGISLGGNVLLKWLGEQGGQSLLTTAVAVSVPFQLRLAADRMSQGFSRIYQRYLLAKLRKTFAKKIQQLREIPPPLQNIERWQCFWTFDENVTAPLHGFSGVHEYYRQSSCRSYLAAIDTPTLILHAIDDPFMTEEALPAEEELSSLIRLELSNKGGHVGFIGGNIPGKPVYWLEERIPRYLKDLLK